MTVADRQHIGLAGAEGFHGLRPGGSVGGVSGVGHGPRCCLAPGESVLEARLQRAVLGRLRLPDLGFVGRIVEQGRRLEKVEDED